MNLNRNRRRSSGAFRFQYFCRNHFCYLQLFVVMIILVHLFSNNHDIQQLMSTSILRRRSLIVEASFVVTTFRSNRIETKSFSLSNSDNDNAYRTTNDLSKKELKRINEYERRRRIWLHRYGTYEALCSTFGYPSSKWGDLSPEQTRRLYHTLLPRSLLGLYEMGLMNPEELAPLAYEARIAAKEYARSRCVWTGRIGTSIFDQYRKIRFGRKSSSMTWEEIWDKYEKQIVEEECIEELTSNNTLGGDKGQRQKSRHRRRDKSTLTMRIYLRILERSCVTNQVFDDLFLHENEEGEADDDDVSLYLDKITKTVETDVHSILLNPKEQRQIQKDKRKIQKHKLKQQREHQKEQEKIQKKKEKADIKEEKRRQKIERKEEKKNKQKKKQEQQQQIQNDLIIPPPQTSYDDVSLQQRYKVLRILAGTRRKFRLWDTSS